MKIDIDALQSYHTRGGLIQGRFGDLQDTACMMSALAVAKEFYDCFKAGWPDWLSTLGAYLYDRCAPEDAFPFAFEFATRLRRYYIGYGDPEILFQNYRLHSVLPIAMEALTYCIGPWRFAAGKVVQWSIDNGGRIYEISDFDKEFYLLTCPAIGQHAISAAIHRYAAGALFAMKAVDAASEVLGTRFVPTAPDLHSSILTCLGEPAWR